MVKFNKLSSVMRDLLVGLFVVSLAVADDTDVSDAEENEECGAPYHTEYDYRQFGEYTRRYFILVDSCGNEIAYSLDSEPAVYKELP